jgi:transposase InsO family protein
MSVMRELRRVDWLRGRTLRAYTRALDRRPAPTVMRDPSDEETSEPLIADDRNYYKVEKWALDWTKVDSLPHAGNSLSRAQSIFQAAIKRRPWIKLTIRQRTRVLDGWTSGYVK